MKTLTLIYDSPKMEILTIEVEQAVLNTSGQDMELDNGSWS